MVVGGATALTRVSTVAIASRQRRLDEGSVGNPSTDHVDPRASTAY